MKRKLSYYLRNSKQYLRRAALQVFPAGRPSFMIIGAQKAATTSLYNYLNQLPGIQGSINKEIYYFDRELSYDKDVAWYHRHFRSFSNPGRVSFFEATPNYLYYPWVAQRLHDYNPELRFIAVLREPISRAYSAWNMYKFFFTSGEMYRLKKGLRPSEPNLIYQYLFEGRSEFPSFDECIAIELELISKGMAPVEPGLLRRGLYASQLEVFYKYFEPHQIDVIGYKDLTTHTEQVVSALYSKITGKEYSNISLNIEKRNSREYAAKPSEGTTRQLESFYANENDRLWKLLGRRINW